MKTDPIIVAMLLDRQKRLLALVDALGGEVDNLDFQKLLYLYCREAEGAPTYEFGPYKYGGFSFTSYADKRRLIEQGLLANEELSWKLTPAGKRVGSIAPLEKIRINQFAKRHASLRGDMLVAEVSAVSYFAIRSEMAERVWREMNRP